MMDLTQMSLAELRTLESDLKKEVKAREEKEIMLAREKIEAIAQSVGISLKDLVAGTRKKSNQVAVKYRHPDNVQQQWSGRGRQPQWVKEWLASGKPLESLQAV